MLSRRFIGKKKIDDLCEFACLCFLLHSDISSYHVRPLKRKLTASQDLSQSAYYTWDNLCSARQVIGWLLRISFCAWADFQLLCMQAFSDFLHKFEWPISLLQTIMVSGASAIFLDIIGVAHPKALPVISRRKQSICKSSLQAEVFVKMNFKRMLAISMKQRQNAELPAPAPPSKTGRARLATQTSQ